MAETNTPRPRRVPRRAVSLKTHGGANQADAAGADINTIVAQFRKTGTMPRVNLRNPLYGDFTFPDDIHSMFEAVAQAHDRFMQLPADVRTAADNEEEIFLEMWKTDEGRKKLEDAGLKINNPPIPNNSPPQPPDPEPTPTNDPVPTPTTDPPTE